MTPSSQPAAKPAPASASLLLPLVLMLSRPSSTQWHELWPRESGATGGEEEEDAMLGKLGWSLRSVTGEHAEAGEMVPGVVPRDDFLAVVVLNCPLEEESLLLLVPPPPAAPSVTFAMGWLVMSDVFAAFSLRLRLYFSSRLPPPPAPPFVGV